MKTIERAMKHVVYVKGKYERGAPKNLPRWVWYCTCGCETFVGLFHTRREAMEDARASAELGREITVAEEESHEAVHH